MNCRNAPDFMARDGIESNGVDLSTPLLVQCLNVSLLDSDWTVVASKR